MDPNAALDRIRDMCELNQSADLTYREVDAVLEHIRDLDHWISSGGFLPTDWERAQ